MKEKLVLKQTSCTLEQTRNTSLKKKLNEVKEFLMEFFLSELN